ncbi:MAG: porin family protein [Roseivirga sp.]
MKKYLLLTAVLFCTTIAAHAQGQLGIKLSPSIAFNRAYSNPDNLGFSSTEPSFQFKVGPIFDYPIKDNYYVSTGLFYSAQQATLKKKKDQLSEVDEAHELQYLQVPILLKLYTSEFTLDMRFYVEFGLIAQVRINERNTSLKVGNTPLIKEFHRWSLAGLIGVGLEYDTSLSTSLFGGISYQRGLISVIKEQQDDNMPKVFSYSDLICFDIGIRF